MKSLKETYDEWRWLTYNQLDKLLIQSMVTGQHPLLIGQKYCDNIHYKNYTEENLKKYEIGDFSVSQNLIESYDKKIYADAKKMTEQHSTYFFGQFYFLRSVFIENCYIDITSFKKRELLQTIKRNIIYYHWWDKLSFQELSNCITDKHFTKSTCKLIPKENLHKYFKNRFRDKTEFANYLLSHFEPREAMINEMNETSRGSVVFDYGWLFQNEFIKSIRIFENECRLEFDEKIVGVFYNENLLFREIKKTFEKKYTVISQGSPEWLGLQRFDIYFPELNIAIEYQGEQHQQPVDFGGKGKKVAFAQFQDNLKRDEEKKVKANQNGCEIIYVYPDYNINQAIRDIKKSIKKKKLSNKASL
ncbi:hypothetical protein [Prolixibacter sp. NT017]|uniref:hypothetical protein n=1 Tax=Prolixibacter sp. NT017 TaxID=2652390 RepID=UPI00127690F5|nr:hypothetical protein [Prolixibacter sp. NT017]GET24896.1 hypothetical protein NT017_12250 [Prolixibacter sp. NT017]